MKKMMVRVLVVAGFGLAVLAGAAAMVSRVEAAGCICPQIYAPVQCDNGKTYPNQCVANCHHAHNCVPVGGPVQ